MTEGYRPKSNGKPMGTPPHKGSGGHKPSDHIEQLTAEVERMQAKLAEMNNSDIIARTMAENERLREALQWAADHVPWIVEEIYARAALEGKQ